MFHKRLFGEALTHLRGDRSQRQVAEQAGISLATWRSWEAGAVSPEESDLPNVLHGLDCTETDLEMTMWLLQAKKLLPQNVEPSIRKALAAHHGQIKVLAQTNYLDQIPENVRRMLIQLQAHLRQTGEGLMAAHEDLDALIGALGRVS